MAVRNLLALCLALGLTGGCTLPAGLGIEPALPSRVSVLNGALTIAAPQGYCVDPAALSQTGDAAVALIGRCTNTGTATAALLTISVGQAGSAGVMTAGGPALAEFFTSTEGRAALSRSGRAADIRVRQAVGAGDAFLLYLSDRAAGDYWRAVTGLRGRLVTISANGTSGAPLSYEAGRALLDKALAAMRAANPGRT